MNTTYKVNRIRVEVICPKCKKFVVTANPKWKYAIDNGSELVCDHCHSHFKIVFELLDRAGELRIEAELPQQDVAELCDCGEPFDESGKCDFCGARARYRNA